jgi:hypothetical protein
MKNNKLVLSAVIFTAISVGAIAQEVIQEIVVTGVRESFNGGSFNGDWSSAGTSASAAQLNSSVSQSRMCPSMQSSMKDQLQNLANDYNTQIANEKLACYSKPTTIVTTTTGGVNTVVNGSISSQVTSTPQADCLGIASVHAAQLQVQLNQIKQDMNESLQKSGCSSL